MTALLQFDGGARPTNPGRAGFAAVVTVAKEKHFIARYIGIHTNNYAEYCGLIVGLKYARSLSLDELIVRSDSKLVVYQVTGEWRIKQPELRPLVHEARKLMTEFKSIDIGWVKRDDNSDADALCTTVIKNMIKNPWSGPFVNRRYDPFARTRTRAHAHPLNL